MRKHKGFSLIEMIVVMAIIAILIAITIPSFDNIIRQSSKSEVDQAVMTMNSSITRNVQDFNGINLSDCDVVLTNTLTPILINDNDLLTAETTQISYFPYFFDDIRLVQNEFNRIRNNVPFTTPPIDYNIRICMPDHETHTDGSITFDLNHSIYIIVKTADNTFIYRNGADVTDEFLPTTT